MRKSEEGKKKESDKERDRERRLVPENGRGLEQEEQSL
jgi:hypothetical protein